MCYGLITTPEKSVQRMQRLSQQVESPLLVELASSALACCKDGGVKVSIFLGVEKIQISKAAFWHCRTDCPDSRYDSRVSPELGARYLIRSLDGKSTPFSRPA